MRLKLKRLEQLGLLTQEEVLEAAEQEMYGMENDGFCLACGAQRGDCEPDAENYECDECGENEVFGAAQIILCTA